MFELSPVERAAVIRILKQPFQSGEQVINFVDVTTVSKPVSLEVRNVVRGLKMIDERDAAIGRLVDSAFEAGELPIVLNTFSAQKAPARVDVKQLILSLSRRPWWREENTVAIEGAPEVDLLYLARREGGLESLTNQYDPFVDAGAVAKCIKQAIECVCVIRRRGDGRAFGTGFLIAGNRLLTCYHVIKEANAIASINGDRLQVSNLEAVFDFGSADGGQACDLGQLQGIAIEEDTNVPFSPDSSLDFVCLTLKGVQAQKRSAFEISAVSPEPYSPALIAQHPGDPPNQPRQLLPLKISWAQPGIIGVTGDKKRVNYFNGTLKGSSGSPVFDRSCRIVALHRSSGESTDFNQGVAISAIVEELESKHGIRLSSQIDVVPTLDSKQQQELSNVVPVKDSPSPEVHVPQRIMKRAFVIQSVGEADTKVRERADRVMEELIRPACRILGYEPVRAHELPEGTITEPIISSLHADPLVIADLGKAPWSPNVLIEIGFRLANGRPLVLLGDKQTPKPSLPIHLSNRRIVPISPNRPGESVEALRANIAKRLVGKGGGWESHFAYVDFQSPVSSEEQSAETLLCTYANKKAAFLYGLDSGDEMVGKSMVELDKRMCGYMSSAQSKAFSDDQERLGVLFNPKFKGDVQVEVPVWFTQHKFTSKMNGKVYLPLLVSHRFDAAERNVVMRTIFAEITSWSWKDKAVRPENGVLRMPHLFRETPATYSNECCLAFDSADAAYMAPIAKMLRGLELKVWCDEDGLDESDSEAFAQQISGSLLLAIPVTRRGIGPWQRSPLALDRLIEHCRARKAHFFLLLPELSNVREEEWQQYLPAQLASVLEAPLFIPLTDEQTSQHPGKKSFWVRIVREVIRVVRSTRS